VIYSYNKTNEMHKFLKFIFGIELCMFRTGPKHVRFYSEYQFEKLVHLVGFIVRIRRKLDVLSQLTVRTSVLW